MRKIDFSTLPEFLQYWQEDIAKLIRHQVVMIEAKGKPAVGATRMGGYPDIPTDREWAKKWKRDGARSTFWDNNYMAQINLDDIPDSVRKSEWPTTGMVWIFFDHDNGEGDCIYDPRPVKDIPLIAQDDRYTMHSCVVETLPWGTSELTDLFFKSDELITAYEDWVWKVTLENSRRATAILGGWIPMIQSFMEDREDVMFCINDINWGDAGSLYLCYKDGEFTVEAQTH